MRALLLTCLFAGAAFAQVKAPSSGSTTATSCSSCVLLTGDQTIAGAKTFTGALQALSIEVTGPTAPAGTGIGEPSGNVLALYTNGVSRISAHDSAMYSTTDGALSLGSSVSQWAGVWADTVVIDSTLAFSATAPTVTSACTSPAVTHGRATSFQIDVGSSCAAVTTAVIGLPAATNGWHCTCYNKSNALATCEQSADTSSSATIINYTRTTGVALAFTDGNDLVISCTGR